MGSTYERELRGILSADRDVLTKVLRAAPPEVAVAYHRVLRNPFMVVRAAGSLGADLVALRHDVAFPIEVKSSTDPVVRFSQASGRLQAQAESFVAETRRAGVLPLYMCRLKSQPGDKWRVSTIPDLEPAGRARVLYARLPKMRRTAAGSLVLDWREGMALHAFLDWMCTEPGGSRPASSEAASAPAAAGPPGSLLVGAPTPGPG